MTKAEIHTRNVLNYLHNNPTKVTCNYKLYLSSECSIHMKWSLIINIYNIFRSSNIRQNVCINKYINEALGYICRILLKQSEPIIKLAGPSIDINNNRTTSHSLSPSRASEIKDDFSGQPEAGILGTNRTNPLFLTGIVRFWKFPTVACQKK